MKKCLQLPEIYGEFCVIDLQNDKKTFYFVNILAVVIGAALFAAGLFLLPIEFFYDVENVAADLLLPLVALVAGMIAYLFLHEGVHGVFFALFSGKKPKFGARLPYYFYAGSDAYFNKIQYLIIGLSPVLFWGVVLAVVNAFAVGAWAWVVYLIQVINLSGAAGDFYVTGKLLKMPRKILVQDDGTKMTVYCERTKETEENG